MRTQLLHPSRVALAVTLTVACLATPVAHAQTAVPPDAPTYALPTATFGFRAGLGSTQFTGTSGPTVEEGTGFTAGTLLTYRLTRHLALQPEALFALRSGAVDHRAVFPGAGRADYRFGFLEVPLLMKLYAPPRAGAAPYLTGGPYAGRRLFEHAEDPNGVLEEVNLDNVFRTWDYGVVAGVGVERFAGDTGLFLDARYHLGLANLFADEERPDFRSRGLTLSVGFTL